MYKPGDSYAKMFSTSNPTTGAATNATGTPVATVNHTGSGTGTFTLTVTPVSTGLYKVTGTIPDTYLDGDIDNISVAATVSGVAGVAVIDTIVVGSKEGYVLAENGLDTIIVETGVNGRQALSINSSALGGVLSGAEGTNVAIAAANNPGTNRIAATVDQYGNRPVVVLNLPA